MINSINNLTEKSKNYFLRVESGVFESGEWRVESGIDDLHIIYAAAKNNFDIKFKPRSARRNYIKKWRVESGEWKCRYENYMIICLFDIKLLN